MTNGIVWYWDGGTQVGTWRQADAGTEEAIRRGGRVARLRATGTPAPLAPPTREEFEHVGFLTGRRMGYLDGR